MASECRSSSPNGRVCFRRFGHSGECSDGTYMWAHPGTVGEVKIIGSPRSGRPCEPSCGACRWRNEDWRCRRYPPQVIAEVEGGAAVWEMYVWPRVGDGDWCGEFEAKK